VATKPFPISHDYTVPAGSMVIPSFFNSMHDPQVFPSPDTLDPDRWLDPNSSANLNPKNYIVFGSGPHRCIGIDYAMMNIALVLANASVLMEMEHEITPLSDEVEFVIFFPPGAAYPKSLSRIIATIFPKDGCRLKFRPRQRS
jgi:C-22 sterol desaturase